MFPSSTVFRATYVIYRPTSRAYATMPVSVCLSVCLSVMEVHWVAVHAGNTEAAPTIEVEAIDIRSPTNNWPPLMEDLALC